MRYFIPLLFSTIALFLLKYAYLVTGAAAIATVIMGYDFGMRLLEDAVLFLPLILVYAVTYSVQQWVHRTPRTYAWCSSNVRYLLFECLPARLFWFVLASCSFILRKIRVL